MAEAKLLQQLLLEAQNSDGGWSYSAGSSWTEPTALALLALAANSDSGYAFLAGVDWLVQNQKADGGWAPQPLVEQSTWVTSLATLVLSGIKPDSHRRGISWLIKERQIEPYSGASFLARFAGIAIDPRPAGGSPWFPGTAAWVNPTSMSILALSNCAASTHQPELVKLTCESQEFILSRRCRDGGWNHGGSRYRSDNAGSYPEMTGIALLALAGADPCKLRYSIERAVEFVLTAATSIEALSWLQLGLLAHGRDYRTIQTTLPCRTTRDTALRLLALLGDSPTNRLLTA